MPKPALVYGANGYTGRLIVAYARERGLPIIVAGRDQSTINQLARQFDCSARVFSLRSAGAIAENLMDVAAVLNCAGPFSRTAAPLIDGCIAAGAHYLDITGEIDVIEMAAARHRAAEHAGVAVIPAVGFDVVPTDCLAAMLADRLPGASRLELAIAMDGQITAGTAKTAVMALPYGARLRKDGVIRRVPLAAKTIEVPLGGRTRTCAIFPAADVATAYHSTGIPNIEVYLAMPREQIRQMKMLNWLAPFLRPFAASHWLTRQIERRFAGPSREERETVRSYFWGRVADDHGRSAVATLEGPSGYQLTMFTATAALERVLAGGIRPGFSTPAMAFGRDFIMNMPGMMLAWESSPAG